MCFKRAWAEGYIVPIHKKMIRKTQKITEESLSVILWANSSTLFFKIGYLYLYNRKISSMKNKSDFKKGAELLTTCLF